VIIQIISLSRADIVYCTDCATFPDGKLILIAFIIFSWFLLQSVSYRQPQSVPARFFMILQHLDFIINRDTSCLKFQLPPRKEWPDRKNSSFFLVYRRILLVGMSIHAKFLRFFGDARFMRPVNTNIDGHRVYTKPVQCTSALLST